MRHITDIKISKKRLMKFPNAFILLYDNVLFSITCWQFIIIKHCLALNIALFMKKEDICIGILYYLTFLFFMYLLLKRFTLIFFMK